MAAKSGASPIMTEQSQKLWSKPGSVEPNEKAVRYMVGASLQVDNRILPFDVEASKAHANMLAEIGILSSEESRVICEKLGELLELYRAGRFSVGLEDEDVHTAIENFLVKSLGPIGKKIHTGRSRNDQVLTALRLFSKHEISEVESRLRACAESMLEFASKNEFEPMPGFTHMQHAMPSSVGQWAGALVESLVNDLLVLRAAKKIIDQNPLGSAAGFGTSVPIDRESTTRALGFARTQINSIYCQNSRAKFDGLVLSALFQIMLTLGKAANDLIVFTSQEFNFFKVHPSFTTGSSIMPQKRNFDVMEVLRSNVGVMQGLVVQVQTSGLNLISGYNKDAQANNKSLLDGFDLAKDSLEIVALVFQALQPNRESLAKAFDDIEIFAADYANELVLKGVPFRDAYKRAAEEAKLQPKPDPLRNIKSKKHLGATGCLALDRLKKDLAAAAAS